MHVHPISRRRAALTLAAAGAIAAICAPSAFAQANANTVRLKKAGYTTVTVNSTMAKTLKKLGIKVTRVSSAKVSGGAWKFPITGGSLDPKTLGPAVINHSGGIQLAKGTRKVKLTNFTIRVGDVATLSAVLKSARANMFDLDASKAQITRPRNGGTGEIGTKVSKVGVMLTAASAKALNAAFKTKAFKSGAKLGTAVVDTRPKELIIESGFTTLTLDSFAAVLLVGQGITPGIIAPATPLAATTFSFPITRSRIATSMTSGSIAHTGGISLTKGPVVLALTDLLLKLGAANTVAVTINGAPVKREILDLDLSTAKSVPKGTTGIVVSDITGKFNQTASDDLKAAFGTPSTAGAKLGTVVLNATAR